MKRLATVLMLGVALGACADSTSPAPIDSPVRAQGVSDEYPDAVLDDGVENRIRSDGLGAYVDGTPWNYAPPHCVISSLGSSGFYMLRTARNSTACNDFASYEERRFLFDLGSPLVDLDSDGIVESIELPSGRFLMDKATGRTSTPVTILLAAGPRWEVEYRSNATTRDGAGGIRIIEAIPGSATADIYERIQVKGRLERHHRGTLDLPFRLTLSR
jgi:hypothetical protein